MKKIRFTPFLLFILLIPIFAFSRTINQTTAEIVAKNYYYDQTGLKQDLIYFESVSVKSINNEVFYYIFNIKNDGGFVIVSADDNYHPIIAYSPDGSFVDENMPDNLEWWMNHYVEQIDFLRDHQIEVESEIQLEWQRYNVPAEVYSYDSQKAKAVEPLCGNILWDQGSGWNEFCPEDAGGPSGHVWAGCVATAMGIVMKFWNYPIHGTGSHSYYIGGYGTLSANFANSTYFWNNMDNVTPNIFSAQLLYHLGISVNMGYAPDGSGAYSFDVPTALENYFQYHTDATYVQRNNYTTENWIIMLKAEIDAGRPVYYSGRNDNNEGHAFVCSGYNDSDLFHFNFGWSGASNGYYSVDDVGSFHVDQGAVIGIHPENTNTYPANPTSFTATLNTSILNDFVVDLSWTAPATKEVANYLVFRDLDQIAELGSATLSYSDVDADPSNFYYSVEAVYANGDESLTESDYIQGLFYVNFVVHDENGNLITSNGVNCQVNFNGETLATGFGSVSFPNVPFGGSQLWSASADGYPSSSGLIDVIDGGSFDIYLDGNNVNIEQVDDSRLIVFPNPVKDVLNIQSGRNSGYRYEILDITGKIILNGMLSSKQTEINVENIYPGYYIIRINTFAGIVSKPIVIK